MSQIFKMNLLLLLMVAQCISMDTSNVVEIVSQVKKHFRSIFVYLLHYEEEYQFINASTLRVGKMLSARNIQVATASFSVIQAILSRDIRPLCVSTSGSKSIKQSIMKYFQNAEVSNAVWLLFLDRNTCMHEFFTDINIPFDCEFLVAQEEDDHVVVLTEVYRVSPSLPLQTYRFGEWTSRGALNWSVNGLFQRRNNFQGLVIRSSVNSSLFVTVITDDANKPVDVGGYVGEVWRVLEPLMNFTSNYCYHGQWRDVVKMIHNGTVDVSIADILMKPQDLMFADFIAPLVDVRTYVVIRMPSKTEVLWTNFLTPFSSRLWIAVLSLMVLIAMSLAFTDRANLCRRDNGILETTNYNYLNSVFYVIGTFCQQAQGSTLRRASSRIVFLTSHLTALVFLASYSASLISSLTVRRPALPFETFQQVLEDGSYRLDVLSNSGELDYFRLNTGDALMRQLYQKLIVRHEADLPSSVLEGLQKVCSGNRQAYFASQHAVKAFLRNLSCSPVIVPRAYIPGTISMSISKNSPYQGLFKYNIQNMRCSGILQRLMQVAFPARLPQSELKLQRMDLATVIPIFSLLAIGLLLTTLLLVIEMKLCHRRWNTRKMCRIKFR